MIFKIFPCSFGPLPRYAAGHGAKASGLLTTFVQEWPLRAQVVPKGTTLPGKGDSLNFRIFLSFSQLA